MRPRKLTFFVILAVMQTLGCDPSRTRKEQQPASQNYSEQSPCSFVQDDLGKIITMAPQISFFAENTLPEEFVPSIILAMTVWNEALGREVFTYAGRADQLAPEAELKLSAQSLIRWSDQWPSDQKDKQAESLITVVQEKITKAVISFNAKDYSYSASVKEGAVNFESVLVHELGHVLGLAHSDVPGSVMFPTLARGVKRNRLGETDYQNIACGYNLTFGQQ